MMYMICLYIIYDILYLFKFIDKYKYKYLLDSLSFTCMYMTVGPSAGSQLASQRIYS